MPWCPKCKNEYKAGYTVCADCGSELVEELVEEQFEVAYFGAKDEIDAMVGFLKDNGFEGIETRYDDVEDQYELLVDKKDSEDLKRVMKTYFHKILPAMKKALQDEGIFTDINEDELKDNQMHLMDKNEHYEKPEDRAEEYKSGAFAMFIVGVAGLILLILADVGIIKFPMYGYGKLLINVVMGGMFLVFFALGIMSFRTYKKLKTEATSDDDLESEIIEWVHNNLSIYTMQSHDVPGEKEEVQYFSRIKIIKDSIQGSFPEAESSFVEYIAEKVYSEYFE